MIQGEEFDIWRSAYHIRRDARVIGQANLPALEPSFVLEHDPVGNLQGVYSGPLVSQQMELYYTPWVDNLTRFEGGKLYQTFDICFQASLLEPYAVNSRSPSRSIVG